MNMKPCQLTNITFNVFLLISCLLPVTNANSGNIETYSPENTYNFSLPDLSDELHTLPDYRGKVVLLNFWASWCPPCIYEMPALKKLKQKLNNQSFEILALNVGEKKYKARKFAKLIKLDLPVLLDTDSKTFKLWNVKTLPTSFLIDTEGKVRYRIQGNPGWDTTETMDVIYKLLNNTTSQTGEVK